MHHFMLLGIGLVCCASTGLGQCMDFDQHADGPIAADFFVPEGILLDRDAAIDCAGGVIGLSQPPTLPNVFSPTNYGACIDYAGFGPSGIEMTFVQPGTTDPQPAGRVRLFSVDGSGNSGGLVALEAYDASGALLDRADLSQIGDNHVHELVVVGWPIASVRFIGSPDSEAVDLMCWTCTPADLDYDQAVQITDLAILLADFGCGTAPCPGDVDANGATDLSDLAALLATFGSSCN